MKDSWKKFKEIKTNELEEHLKKNSLDAQIVQLIRKINKNPNLVTISSCAGRIVLTTEGNEKEFHRKWHREVKPEEIELAIIDYKLDQILWFRCEPFILHVAAKDLKSTHDFIRKVKNTRIEHSGIQSISKDKIIIEIQGTGNISIPINYVEGSWNKIIKLANEMLENNFKKIKDIQNQLSNPDVANCCSRACSGTIRRS